MRLTFRSKLIAIVAVDAFALLALVLLSKAVERRVERQLTSIQVRLVPRVGLEPRLQATMETIARNFQDAAGAADVELIADARRSRDELVAQLAAADDAVADADADALKRAVDDYVASADVNTRRMIDGDGGEDAIAGMEEMQAKQHAVVALIARAARFDENEMKRAFTAATAAQRSGARIRLALSGACVVLVLILTFWIGRGLFQNLGDLSAGFRRFGDGDFATPIPAGARDELGDAARQANQMAERLRRLMAERERSAWIESGHAGLADSLRGELEPEEVADRAAAFLARHVGAPIAALYYARDDGTLARLGGYGVERDDASVRLGEGRIGQAALATDVTIIDGKAALVPLVHLAGVVGVLELESLEPWTERATELLVAVRATLTITIEVARARAATRALLAKTQRQAAELLSARTGLVEQAEELTRASAYKSQFLANMSHELRTPLNAIIGFSELLHAGEVRIEAEQQREFLGHILDSGRHLLQLINDVLDLSKVEAGKLDFNPEPISVERTINAVLSILRTIAAARRVRVEATVDPAVDEVVIDPARFKQVLYNYVSNALKFTAEGGRVAVRVTAAPGDCFRLEVEDTGIGISADDLGKLFGEFQQVGSGARRPAGTGLGLALTKRLVEAQGGTVGVRSIVGAGSTFHAILPRHTAAAIAAPAVTPTTTTPGNAPTVLVIEDDRDDQRALAAALAVAGYAVEVAATGAAALALARERVFDAITLDLLLPDMTGLELLRQLRTTTRHQQVPVVVVTVVAERDAIAGFAVQEVLCKPLDADALVAALERADVRPGAARTVLVVDDDPAALEIMGRALDRLGYRSACERDAPTALRSVRDAPPLAIVLDLLMPGMSGFEFLDLLRGDPNGRQVPVIVWTSADLTSDERARLRASADAVVAKGHGGAAAVIAEISAHAPVRPAA